MRVHLIFPISRLKGEILIPGDKSISHRAIIISSLADDKTKIENFLVSEDTIRTLEVFKSMGIKIKFLSEAGYLSQKKIVIVYGRGLSGLRRPKSPLYMGGSGTTCRLILGILAGQDFETEILGDEFLSKRPMARVTEPIRKMGAEIKSKIIPTPLVSGQRSKSKEEYLPIVIKGRFPLKPIVYRLSIPSAQVKSALLLAGLFAKGETVVSEPLKTRDHTERMLRAFRANIKREDNKVIIKGLKELKSPKRIFIPSDISSASFFIAGAIILPGSNLIIKSIGLNPTRIGIIKVLREMGADIKIKNQKSEIKHFEPVGDIVVKASDLKAVTIREGEIPSLIDELPILMVCACFAKGKTSIKDVGELRVKETDRLNSMVFNLRRMGADIKIKSQRSSRHLGCRDKNKIETIVINGGKALKGTKLSSYEDHRTAMSLIIAGLKAEGKSCLDDIDCIKKSFPDFLEILAKITIK